MFEDVDEGHLDGEEKIVFRYNREERLKKAPQIVRDYYDGKLQPVKGIRVFWVYKQNRYVLFSLILFIAFVWGYSGLNSTRRYTRMNNVDFDLMAFSYEEEVYVNLKVMNKKADEKSPPVKVEAEFFFIDADNQLIEKKEMSLVYRNGEEYLRTKIRDYDIIRVDIILTVDGKDKEISTTVKR